MDKTFTLLGSLFLLTSVGLGAFGAHALAPYFHKYPHLAKTFDTAVQYHQLHALGLFAIAWATTHWPSPMLSWAGWLIVLGIILFCGSLYLLVASRISLLGAITPIGGVCFIVGWLMLFVAVWRN